MSGPAAPTARPADRNITRVDTFALTRRRSARVRRIGGYELLREIGSGGMATVWQGRRSTFGGGTKMAAIKLMSRELSEKSRYREMFMAETRLSMLLNYRNVVQVFDAGEEGGQCYLVMEWLDGVNLGELVSMLRDHDRSLGLVVVAYVVGEVLRGLAYAQTITHEGAPLGVVHRDISPQNVLVSVSGEVKLTDFGVARLASEETSGNHAPGKLRYMAPEQLRGRSREPTVDLYAVGAILHELIDGRKFRDAVDNDHLSGLVLAGVVPELQNPREVPIELDILRRKLLEADPSRRIQRAEDAVELLSRWSGYRDASTELARLCQSCLGVSGPRSGVHARAAVMKTPTGEPTQTAATRKLSNSGPLAAAATVTAVDVPAVPDLPTSPSPAAGYPLGLVVGLAGALVAVVGILVAVAWVGFETGPAESSHASEASRVLEPLEDPPVGSVAGRAPQAEAPGQPVRRADVAADSPPAAGAPLAGAESMSEVQAAPVRAEPAPATKPAKAKAKAKGRATVTFKTGDFTFVWVKVNGKVLALEPVKSIRLPSGQHRVFFRMSEAEPWEPAGKISVEPAAAYEVRMRKPGKLELSRL